ncbi:hypothetical protein [Bosea sp. BIWAKO-01]|uniref:hypothetical protein n=1 Tax=Bosea sp. BIWAKO-01 TaxID=506668 RepID=UPI001FCD1E83|nr:hypothetical protein [Bosea sp. BIWAKO-01]
MELYAVSEPEGVGQPSVRNVNALGEQRPYVSAGAIADEALDDVENDAVGVVVTIDARVAASDIGSQRHLERRFRRG